MWGPASNGLAVADGTVPDGAVPVTGATVIMTTAACLDQTLEAFCDIADRDDIHQAAIRLGLVQAWIRREAATAAADPIFSSLALA